MADCYTLNIVTEHNFVSSIPLHFVLQLNAETETLFLNPCVWATQYHITGLVSIMLVSYGQVFGACHAQIMLS